MARLLFTADIHLRSSNPKCRTDDFISAQWDKIQQVIDLCRSKRAIWIDAGDLFHNARPSLSLISDSLNILSECEIYTIPGNHDLPAHNIKLLNDSAIGVLHNAGIVHFLSEQPTEFIVNKIKIHVYGCPYGAEIPTPIKKSSTTLKNVLVMHEMFYESRKDVIPNAPGQLAARMLKKYEVFDLMVTGHNHRSFQRENGQRHFVNVGCLTRQAADYDNHSPRVLLYNGNDIEFISLKYAKNVISREHIEISQKKEEEISAFVQQLQHIEDIALSFEHNVETVIKNTKPDQKTTEKIWEAMS